MPLAWHPLADHCADVAAVMERLLADAVIRRRLARLAGIADLDGPARARLCVLAALHDAGKANHGFQRKCDPTARDVAGHVTPLVEALLARDQALRRSLERALRVDLVTSWRAESLLIAALAHHGRPPRGDARGLGVDAKLWRAGPAGDPAERIADLASNALAWFPQALVASPAFPEAPALSHAFAGLVTWADWLASDRSLFPFSEPGDPPRIGRARDLAEKALARTWLDPRPARAAVESGFTWSSAFEFAPNPMQRALLGAEIPDGGGVVAIEAETGSGKTEAAIAWFMRLFARGEVDGLYFALPTRTAAVQIHGRVRSACERVLGARTPPVILAVPGYTVARPGEAPAGGELCDPEALWPDDEAARRRWRTWAEENAKRFLTGLVSVGTVDQVLLGALQVPHAHLRSGALLRQLLVVDEVHASDAYMNVLLEEILARHAAAGGHALLMSATLGAPVRERLLGAGGSPPGLAASLEVPYPVLSIAARGLGDGRREPSLIAIPPDAGRAKLVAMERRPVARDPAAVARIALEAAERGGRVIVLRNLVADAVATQVAAEEIAGEARTHLLFRCAGLLAPHHSRYAAEDRRCLDAALEQAFGRPGVSTGMVVVATQTVQQSLDLDCDLLVTDLCPMDVLLQRIGRLHRHERSRAPGFEGARAVVLRPAEELGGFIQPGGKARGPCGVGSVYEDLRQLEATMRLVEEKRVFEIPVMNRELVERGTHPEALAEIVTGAGGGWSAHAATCIGVGYSKANQGQLNKFDWHEPYESRPFDPALAATAPTRLGAGDRLAVFDPPLVSPFGQTIHTLSVPHWLAMGVGDEERPRVLEQDESVRWVRFRFGSLALQYDRLGLRKGAPGEAEEGNSNG